MINKDLLYSTGNSAPCLWQPGWEGSLGEDGCMYMYGWVPLPSTWNHHNTVNWLCSNTKYKALKKKEYSISWSTFTGLGGHISVLTSSEDQTRLSPCSEGNYCLVAGTCRPAGSVQPFMEQWRKSGFGRQPCKECTTSTWGAWKA